MKFAALQENMARGLRAVSPAIERQAYHPPVLSNVALHATEEGRLTLAGTDLEVRLDCRIGAKVDEPGMTTVPARLLHDFVKTLPPERMDFSLDLAKSELTVTCGKNVAVLQGIPYDEYPLAPVFEEEHYLTTIPAPVLETMARRCYVAAEKNRDSGRPILNGVLVHFDGPDLTMAGADGYRLSVCSERFDAETWEPLSVVVPVWGFSGLKGLKLKDEEVQIFVDKEARAAFRMHSVDLTLQLIPGKFPNYNQIIPSGYDTKTVVNTTDLLRACKTARIFAKLQAEIMRLEIQDDTLRVVSETDEMGGMNATIPAQVEPSSGPAHWLDIAFNAKFFLEALDVMGSEQVQLLTTDSTSPAILRPVGEEADSFTHVLMPMSLKSMPN